MGSLGWGKELVQALFFSCAPWQMPSPTDCPQSCCTSPNVRETRSIRRWRREPLERSGVAGRPTAVPQAGMRDSSENCGTLQNLCGRSRKTTKNEAKVLGKIQSSSLNQGGNSVPSGFGKGKRKFGKAPRVFWPIFFVVDKMKLKFPFKTAGKILSRGLKPW